MDIKNFLNYYSQEYSKNTIFSRKDLYEMNCSSQGYDMQYLSLKETDRALVRQDNMYLSLGLKTAKWGVPCMEAYTGSTEFEFVAFTKRNKCDPRHTCIHFFCYDHLINQVWNKFETTTYSLKDFACLLTPDFSLYSDAPLSVNLHNVYKSRLIGARWQSYGFSVIPTAGMPNAECLQFAYEGLPQNSVIAHCGVGYNKTFVSKMIWETSIRELIERKNPRLLIIYGKATKIYGVSTPILFINDEITKYHRI
jgi:hypothetical protein